MAFTLEHQADGFRILDERGGMVCHVLARVSPLLLTDAGDSAATVWLLR